MKNKKKITILLGTVLVAVVFVAGYYIAMAATYYWTQNSWVTENLTGVAVHGTNNDSWDEYSAKSSNADISSGTSITITQETAAETHTSELDFSNASSSMGIDVVAGGSGDSGQLELVMP